MAETAAPLTVEIASIDRDPYVPQYQNILPPTDEVLRQRGSGKGFDLYDEIRRDPHAFSVLQKRGLEVVSREIMVVPASDRRRDKQAAELVEKQIKAMNFDRLTRALLGGAVLKGFAVGEAMWEVVDGVWTITKIKVKKQRRFRFDVDGNLRLLTRAARLDGELVPDRKFVVHRHSIDDDDDDPYGVGLGAVLYWPAWFKRQVLAAWLRGGERYAAPTVDASYAGTLEKQREEELMQAIRAMQNDTGIVHPDSVKLELLEAQRGGGGDMLEALSRYLDEMMSTAVLGESLSTSAGDNGSRALGEVQADVRVGIAKADADLVCHTINDSLVRWIVDVNMPGAGYPTIWRDFSEVEDLNKKVDRDTKIVTMGYRPKSVDYINETYGGDWVEAAPADTASAPGSPPAGQLSDKLAFAEKTSASDRVVTDLSDQLEQAGGPIVDAMIEAVRAEFAAAISYDDLVERLARLSSELGIDDFAAMMEQGITLARLEGHDSVTADG